MARRGRPRLSEHPLERVDVRLPRPLYDALCRAAFADEVSLQKVIRTALCRFLTVKNRQQNTPAAS